MLYRPAFVGFNEHGNDHCLATYFAAFAPILNSVTLYLKQQSAVFTRVGRYRVTGAADQMGAVYFAECSIQFIE